MPLVLRPVDPADPRPSILDAQVALAAIDSMIDDLEAWVRGRVPADRDMIRFAVASAIKVGGQDGFRVAACLREVFHWPADDKLVALMKTVGVRLHEAASLKIGEWVARTGIRFPGKPGDMIEFITEDGPTTTGVVAEMLTIRASALVTVVTADGTDGQVLVKAEHVVGNITQSRFQTERPVLGMRYTDAPALAAAFEADRAATRRAHLVPETDAEREVREMLSDERCHVTIDDGPSAA